MPTETTKTRLIRIEKKIDEITKLVSGSTPPPPPPPPALKRMLGVNLAGAEFAPESLPGVYGQAYIYPTPGEVDYFMSKGMNTFRVPFRWERIMPGDKLEVAEKQRLDGFVKYATDKGAYVILDPHNYGRFNNQVPPASKFAAFWGELATAYKNNPKVVFGLMNEPHDISPQDWLNSANAAIAMIREKGATNLILVPGTSWTGAHSWVNSGNALVMLGVKDPKENYAFEVHQYFDNDSSGRSPDVTSETIGSERMKDFTKWCKDNGKKGFMGEFGAANNPRALNCLKDFLTYLEANKDIYIGWTFWSAGPWWGEYIFTIEPKDGQDRPQMAIIKPFLTN